MMKREVKGQIFHVAFSFREKRTKLAFPYGKRGLNYPWEQTLQSLFP